MEALVARFTQNVWWLPSRKWNFQSRKKLRQIFKILSHRFLAACSGDLFTTYFSRENCVYCTLRVFFKTVFKKFLVFPHILWQFIVSFFQTHHVHSQELHFLHHLFTNLQEKGIGSLIFLKIFMFKAFEFLDFVFELSFENMMFEYWFGYFLLSLMNGFCQFWQYDASYTCWEVYFVCVELSYHAHCKMSQRHLLVGLWTSWFIMCLALPAQASHLHTTCTSATQA